MCMNVFKNVKTVADASASSEKTEQQLPNYPNGYGSFL